MRRSFFFLLAVALCMAAFAAQESSNRGVSQDDELEVFVPSEEVPADSSVSFPVDI